MSERIISESAEALASALTAEYAAIWAYGPVGVRLSGAERKAAVEAEASHRTRRDALVVQLSTGGGSVPPDQAGYALPFPVTDRASALRLAVQVEERTAAFWRAALPVSSGAERDRALAALMEYAVRATRWRRSAGITPLTVPFPGRPG
ncbi:ferritin-like domain-containing protein [Micromonospora sp. C51]|uniref:ferritin-like domain-containing protein n=1 Tax=Micromonospora sp. C51 TaxID=2824879 RepID=UPI001B35B9E0|nr:ferritin-like domain-containing protein [Micromonospora sp. C51]MBQ1049325.1 ferritin-like domain-containing protein [Micromonospora sp. C51]